MQPDWLKLFETRFREQLTPVSESIQIEYPAIKCVFDCSPWGQATGADGNTVALGCLISGVSLGDPDLLELVVSFTNISGEARITADVCWGHPSGHIEAEWNESEVIFSPEAADNFFHALPRLVTSLLHGLQRQQSASIGT